MKTISKRVVLITSVFFIIMNSVFGSYKVSAAGIPFALWTAEDVIMSLMATLGLSFGGYSVYDNYGEIIQQDAEAVRDSIKEYAKSEYNGTSETFDLWLDQLVADAQTTGDIVIDRTSAGWKLLKEWINEIGTPLTKNVVDVSSGYASVVVSNIPYTLNESVQSDIYTHCLGADGLILFEQPKSYLGQGYDAVIYHYLPVRKVNLTDTVTFDSSLLEVYVRNTAGKIVRTYSSSSFYNVTIRLETSGVVHDMWVGGNSFGWGETMLYNSFADVIWPPSEYATDIVGKIGVRNGIDTLIHDGSYVDNYDIITPGNTVTRDDTGGITISGDIVIPVDDVDPTADVINPPSDDVIPVDVPGEVVLPGDIPIDDVVPVETVTDDTTPTDPEEPEPNPDDSDTVTDKTASIGGTLKTLFPFCIPFDLISAFKILKATPQDPKWEWTLKVDSMNFEYTFVLDFSKVTILATIFRYGVLLLFIVGLILLTRNIIRG